MNRGYSGDLAEVVIDDDETEDFGQSCLPAFVFACVPDVSHPVEVRPQLLRPSYPCVITSFIPDSVLEVYMLMLQNQAHLHVNLLLPDAAP